MPYAVLTDIEAKWPLSSATAQTRATVLLEEGGALLDMLLPALAANVAAGTVSPILVRMVLTDAAIRVLANPAGIVSQTLGPEAVTYSGARTLGTLVFTPAELAALSPAGADPSVGGMAIGSASLKLPRGLERELHPRGSYYRVGGDC